MTFSVDLQFDDSVDTKNMAPEDDFAPVGDPAVPHREDGSRDLEADQFRQQQNLPDAYAQPTKDQFPSAAKVHDGSDLVNDDDGYEQATPAAPAEEQAESADETQTEVEFAPELLAAAGVSLEEAERDFGSADALRAAVRMLDTRFVNEGQKLAAQPHGDETQDIVVEEETWELPKPEDSDDWDPDTKKLVNALDERTKALLSQRDARIAEQEAFIKQYVADQERARQEQQLAEFDTMINGLPNAWAPLLGKGTAYELDPKSLAFSNRVHLEQTMNALQNGNLLAGRQPIPHDELFVRSLAQAFPEAQRASIRQEVVEEVDSRRRLMTARPTQRRQPVLSPTKKATQSAEEWYRQRTGSVDGNYDEEFEL